MALVSLKIRCRISEVTTIGGFLLDSLGTDLADFEQFSPDFDAAYLAAGKAQLAAVDALINPKQFTAELKVITQRMRANMGALRGMMDALEGYVERAEGLTMAAAGFGIGAVRKANNRRDVEGLTAAIGYVLGNVANNMAALAAKGYTAAQRDALAGVRAELLADNTAQNAKVNARNVNVVANNGVINAFWRTCMDICATGKRIYRTAEANKVDDYTVAALVRRIRQEQKRDVFEGVVTMGGSGVKKAKLWLSPVTRGYRRSVTTNRKGQFVLKGLAAGSYMVTVLVGGAVVASRMVTIVTGEARREEFSL